MLGMVNSQGFSSVFVCFKSQPEKHHFGSHYWYTRYNAVRKPLEELFLH
jgi:hypothetical protein